MFKLLFLLNIRPPSGILSLTWHMEDHQSIKAWQTIVKNAHLKLLHEVSVFARSSLFPWTVANYQKGTMVKCNLQIFQNLISRMIQIIKETLFVLKLSYSIP